MVSSNRKVIVDGNGIHSTIKEFKDYVKRLEAVVENTSLQRID